MEELDHLTALERRFYDELMESIRVDNEETGRRGSQARIRLSIECRQNKRRPQDVVVMVATSWDQSMLDAAIEAGTLDRVWEYIAGLTEFRSLFTDEQHMLFERDIAAAHARVRAPVPA